MTLTHGEFHGLHGLKRMTRRTGWIGSLVGCGFLLGAVAPALGQVSTQPAQAGSALQVGVVAAVGGTVQIARVGAVGRIVQSGQPVFLGDEVSTGPEGRLQILLLDETTFTIGPNSAIVIDQFVYDPRTETGKVAARAVRGVFRFITGKIARKRPEDMQVQLPAGVIGIRGTMVAGQIEGQRSLVVLLGPGERNNTGDRPGRVTVSNLVVSNPHPKPNTVILTRPGYGTQIAGPNVAPTPPAPVPAKTLEAINQQLGPVPKPAAPEPTATPKAEKGEEKKEEVAGKESATAAAKDAGQETFAALNTLEKTTSIAELTHELAEDSTESAQDAAADAAGIADGISKLEDLRTVETGQFHYKASGTFTQTKKSGSPSDIAGTMEMQVDIDFGARTVGGGNSKVILDTSSFGGNISATEVIESQSFASGTGNAIFTDTSSNGHIKSEITVENAGGVAGKQADLKATYDDGGSNFATGSVANVQRTSGLSP